ncbi:Putative lipoprotein [Leptospira santarosai]|nr:Putative lipoprotein [Leptospira santarosai]
MQIKIKSLIAISIVLLVACSCKAKESSTFNDIPDEVPLYQAVQTDAKRIGILKRGESYEVQKEESISFTDEIGGYSESFSWSAESTPKVVSRLRKTGPLLKNVK